jgi:hypothetical protein
VFVCWLELADLAVSIAKAVAVTAPLVESNSNGEYNYLRLIFRTDVCLLIANKARALDLVGSVSMAASAKLAGHIC